LTHVAPTLRHAGPTAGYAVHRFPRSTSAHGAVRGGGAVGIIAAAAQRRRRYYCDVPRCELSGCCATVMCHGVSFLDAWGEWATH
jgi:hypothetical protein